MERFARLFIRLGVWPRLAVAVSLGAVSALALAPFCAFPILWVTMPSLVWMLDGAVLAAATKRRAIMAGAAVGWCFGLGYFLAGLWWIGTAFLIDGDQFAWLMPLAVLVLPAGLALFWALGAGLAAAFWRPGWPRILVLAIAMASVEWLRGHVLTGFPWNAFGYTLAPTPVMMQSAALVGIWGLTLAAFVIFAAPAALAQHDDGPRRGTMVFILSAIALLAAHVGFGAVRLAGAGRMADSGPAVRIVQPSLDQSEKWQAENENEIVDRYLALSGGDSRPGKELEDGILLVWPESAFPFVLGDRPDVLARIAALLPPQATLITGAVRAEEPASGPLLAYNSVIVVDDAGAIVAAYDKIHLVPFGEYLPFRWIFDVFGIRQLIAIPEGFSPGHTRLTLTIPGAPPFAPLICYEIVFPGEVVAPGIRPGWMLNLTNDTWFGDTPGPYQHFLQGRVRAVEEGLPLVRAANSGISGIVDAYGRIAGELGLDRTGVVDGIIPPAAPLTPYARFGDWIFAILLLCCLTLPVVATSSRAQRR
jgi:apolipoprotein N-acyltransferase